MKLIPTTRGNKPQKYLLRGDSEGFVTLWAVPDVAVDTIKEMQVQRTPPECKFLLSDVGYQLIALLFPLQS